MKLPFEERNFIREVCTDMDPFYINIGKECFPKAHIVIDHYHVIQWGLQKLDRVRCILQTVHKKNMMNIKHILLKSNFQLKEEEFLKLKGWFEKFPELKTAWKIIHQFRKIYWQKNWKQAYSQLRKVIWLCNQSKISDMEDLAKTLMRWKFEILNYYISKTTNAKTEALHNRFETIKRLHCGVRNIKRFSKRLMFCTLPFSIISYIFAQTV